MIRDITIGQYYSADSAIHKLDPRVKVICVLAYIVSLFCFDGFGGYVVAGLFFCMAAKLSKVPFRFMVRGLKPIMFMLVFTAALNLFWTPGETVLIKLGFVSITLEGVKKTIFMSLRLFLLILGSSLMTLTTTPNQLTDALESLLGPLKAVGAPVHEIAMMMSIALRFIPILIEETDKIMKAQLARGADFESGGILRRIKGMMPILVPLFVSASRRAGDLALAMDSRCYVGGRGRTKMKPLKYKPRDVAAYLIFIGYIAVLAAATRLIPI